MNIYQSLLKLTLFGTTGLISLCFAWYSFLGEDNNPGDYWLAMKYDKLCQKDYDRRSFNCYRAEIHRANALALADWGFKLGAIGTIATVGLALSKKNEDNNADS